MLEILISFIVGAACATIVWFFVWRNNKVKFSGIVECASRYIEVVKEIKIQLAEEITKSAKEFNEALDQVGQVVEDGKNTKTQMIKKLREIIEALKK